MGYAQYLDKEALEEGVLKLGEFPVCPECKERQGWQERGFMRIYGKCEECISRREDRKDKEKVVETGE